MKKLRLVLISAVMFIMLCACGEEKTLTQVQQERLTTAGTTAKSYVIPTLTDFAQNPSLYNQTPYTEFTYDELETIVQNYVGQFPTDGYAFANAVSSFEKGIAEAGNIVSVGDVTATLDGNEIIVDIECICEIRKADIQVIFTNDGFAPKMTSAAFNARYTMAEKMSKAGLNTLIGMGTVFCMLIIISFIISLFGLFSGTGKKSDKTIEGINRAVEQIEKNETAELSADTELVAVIAAAIAAYEGRQNTDGFTVRSVRKVKRQ